jgi:16S rRNA (guanine527-N7)-methyltransferase
MHDLTVSAVAEEIERHFRPLGYSEAASLTHYLQLLLAWNRKMNLVGPQDWRTICRSLILDSLHLTDCLASLPLPREPSCLDIGSGAGLPGVPLRILWSAGSYLLVEPRSKRATFLRYAISSLGLERTQVAEIRVEDLPKSHGGADLLLSRAFRSWQEILSTLGHLIGSRGLVLIFSNTSWENVAACPEGWQLQRQLSYTVDKDRQRYFWFFSPMT